MLRDSGYSATLTKIFENAIYGIYSNKRRGTYLIFRPTSAALIRGRLLFEDGAYLNILLGKVTFSIFLFNGTLSICYLNGTL